MKKVAIAASLLTLVFTTSIAFASPVANNSIEIFAGEGETEKDKTKTKNKKATKEAKADKKESSSTDMKDKKSCAHKCTGKKKAS